MEEMEYISTATSCAPQTEPDWKSLCSGTANVTYGLICIVCFVIGTIGNTICFTYFMSKKTDMATVIYIFITVNDILISAAIFPVGWSFLTCRKPGFLFGHNIGCATWWYLWENSMALSIFLVICLSISRVHSLLRPFDRVKIRYFIISVAIFVMLKLVQTIWLYALDETKVFFSSYAAQCTMGLELELSREDTSKKSVLLFFEICRDITYLTPPFVVCVSSIVSAVLLVSRRGAGVDHLRRSRKRATVTIILFALLYECSNVPMVVDIILQTYNFHSKDWESYVNLFSWDKLDYYKNGTYTLLLAFNSAANPVLYFWRMPAIRKYIKRGYHITAVSFTLFRRSTRDQLTMIDRQPSTRPTAGRPTRHAML